MKFYPHNIGGTLTIAKANTATLATTSSFINNFSAVGINLVNTASVAANIRGPAGTNGSNSSPAISGSTGPRGPAGVQGPRGLNIWLLSSSWAEGCTNPPVSCYTISLNKYLGSTCTSEAASPAYTTRINSNGGLVEGFSPIYTDSTCNTAMPAGVILGHDGAIAYQVNASNTASFYATCGTGPTTMCSPITLYNTGPEAGLCNTNNGSNIYYTTSSLAILYSNITGTADGTILYTNSDCTTPAGESTNVHAQEGVIFDTDASGVITTSGCSG